MDLACLRFCKNLLGISWLSLAPYVPLIIIVQVGGTVVGQYLLTIYLNLQSHGSSRLVSVSCQFLYTNHSLCCTIQDGSSYPPMIVCHSRGVCIYFRPQVSRCLDTSRIYRDALCAQGKGVPILAAGCFFMVGSLWQNVGFLIVNGFVIEQAE